MNTKEKGIIFKANKQKKKEIIEGEKKPFVGGYLQAPSFIEDLPKGVKTDSKSPWITPVIDSISLLEDDIVNIHEDWKSYKIDSTVIKKEHKLDKDLYRLSIPWDSSILKRIHEGLQVEIRECREEADIYIGYIWKIKEGMAWIGLAPSFPKSAVVECRFLPNTKGHEFFIKNLRWWTHFGDLDRVLGTPIIKPTEATFKEAGKILWSPSPSQRGVINTCLKATDSRPIIIKGNQKSGRTISCLELICQLLNNQKNEKILVCAPFNANLDYFYYKLQKGLQLPAGSILRIHPTFRDARKIHRFCQELNDPQFLQNEEGMFDCPCLESILKAKVVLITPSCAWYLLSRGINYNHFTRIIFDDSNNVLLAHALVPLKLAGPNTKLVFFGGKQKPIKSLELTSTSEDHYLFHLVYSYRKNMIKRLAEERKEEIISEIHGIFKVDRHF